MDAHSARDRSHTYSQLAGAFFQARPGLEPEFTRLFLGPGRPVAHPYESVYREGYMMGRSTLDVRQRMAREGLAPASQTAPDHISLELAFMAHLADREEQAWQDDEADQARTYVARQVDFLRDHLGRWVPQFCHRLRVGRAHPYYAELARQVEALVTDDLAGLQSWLGVGPGDENAGADRQAWWRVSLGGECTLCDICTQVCRTWALQRARDEAVISLRFDARLCDGCAACRDWCPEQSLALEQVEDCPPAGEIFRSELLTCPRCGQPHAPATLVAKIQARVGSDDPALLEQLALCQNCKVASTSLRRHTR
jgi:TorA maturation chaperone TorD/Pyruvate/2-oxoacid:ferredoxin oxidoreductase delta subunit